MIGSDSFFAVETTKDDGGNLLVFGTMGLVVFLTAWLAVRYMLHRNNKD
jgi:hypothetical protein